MIGFTYNGKHCSELKVKFISDASSKEELSSDFDVIDYERSWMPGGEYFKPRVKTKNFELKCFYEEITDAELQAIRNWLDRRTSGNLIFDRRPHAKYFVRPTKIGDHKDYTLNYSGHMVHSGVFTATLTAYYPFAELIYTIEETAPEEALNELKLLPRAYQPTAITNVSTDGIIYNPGTEVGHSIIQFAGSTGSSNLVIENLTTGDVCEIKAGLTTPADTYYEINSKTGRFEKVTATGRTVDFAFHDKGYIKFAPNTILADRLKVNKTANSRDITSYGVFTEDMLGQYIFIEGGWKYLGTYTSPKTMSMNVNASSTGSEDAKVATMNRLIITKAADANITTLSVACMPEVR